MNPLPWFISDTSDIYLHDDLGILYFIRVAGWGINNPHVYLWVHSVSYQCKESHFLFKLMYLSTSNFLWLDAWLKNIRCLFTCVISKNVDLGVVPETSLRGDKIMLSGSSLSLLIRVWRFYLSSFLNPFLVCVGRFYF